jgi:hypothetical protein
MKQVTNDNTRHVEKKTNETLAQPKKSDTSSGPLGNFRNIVLRNSERILNFIINNHFLTTYRY